MIKIWEKEETVDRVKNQDGVGATYQGWKK